VTVRLVATDLDGTFLRSDGTVSPRTRAAIDAADAAGLLIAFVTGRPPRWLDEVADASGHHGVAVGANGAVLYDLAEGSVISMRLLPPEVLSLVTTELRSAFPDISFAVEYSDSFAAEDGYVHDWAINPRVDRQGRSIAPPLITDLPTLVARPGLKLLAKDRGAAPDALLAAAVALLAGRASVTSSSSFGLLEVGAPGVTKATGLAELAARHGVLPAEVVAVGDMPNDVPMLRWAGTSYAVANAHDAAKAAADEILGSNDDDAVAALIESLL
jgi:hydroxymethylpyrimidine pyrophosphatase-like HAD family hydrolase